MLQQLSMNIPKRLMSWSPQNICISMFAVLLIITDNVEQPVVHISIQIKAMKAYIDVTMIVIIDASHIYALE